MEETTTTTNKQAGEEILKEWGKKERENPKSCLWNSQGFPGCNRYRDVTVTGGPSFHPVGDGLSYLTQKFHTAAPLACRIFKNKTDLYHISVFHKPQGSF